MEKLPIQSQSSLRICLQWCGLKGTVYIQQSLLQNSTQILSKGLCRVAKGKASEVFWQTQSPVELCEVISESKNRLRIGNASDRKTFEVQRGGIEGILTTCALLHHLIACGKCRKRWWQRKLLRRVVQKMLARRWKGVWKQKCCCP